VMSLALKAAEWVIMSSAKTVRNDPDVQKCS
jgi:hypothetical protein